MFICNTRYSNYDIFDSEKYNVIKSIRLPLGFKFEGLLNNDLIVFTQKYMCFYFMNIKYFEIVQIFNYEKNNHFIEMSHRSLYEFLFSDGLIEIKKFSIEKACFEHLVIIITKKNNMNMKNILYFDDGSLYLTTENKLEIYNY